MCKLYDRRHAALPKQTMESNVLDLIVVTHRKGLSTSGGIPRLCYVGLLGTPGKWGKRTSAYKRRCRKSRRDRRQLGKRANRKVAHCTKNEEKGIADAAVVWAVVCCAGPASSWLWRRLHLPRGTGPGADGAGHRGARNKSPTATKTRRGPSRQPPPEAQFADRSYRRPCQ